MGRCLGIDRSPPISPGRRSQSVIAQSTVRPRVGSADRTSTLRSGAFAPSASTSTRSSDAVRRSPRDFDRVGCSATRRRRHSSTHHCRSAASARPISTSARCSASSRRGVVGSSGIAFPRPAPRRPTASPSPGQPTPSRCSRRSSTSRISSRSVTSSSRGLASAAVFDSASSHRSTSSRRRSPPTDRDGRHAVCVQRSHSSGRASTRARRHSSDSLSSTRGSLNRRSTHRWSSTAEPQSCIPTSPMNASGSPTSTKATCIAPISGVSEATSSAGSVSKRQGGASSASLRTTFSPTARASSLASIASARSPRVRVRLAEGRAGSRTCTLGEAQGVHEKFNICRTKA